MMSIVKFKYTRVFFMIISAFYLCPYNSYGENDELKKEREITASQLFKVGLEVGAEYNNPRDLNIMLSSWNNSFEGTLGNMLLQEINTGFVANGYLAVSPVWFFDIRSEFDFIYTPKVFKHDYGTKALDFKAYTYAPGVTMNFLLGNWRLGGGIFKYHSQLEWKDHNNNYFDTWMGLAYGYQAYVGINPKSKSNLGMTIDFIYRNIVIDDFRNSHKQVVMAAGGDRNFILDLTAFEFRLGIYYKFLRIGGKNETK